MGIWILTQDKTKLVLCKNIIIDLLTKIDILEFDSEEKYFKLGTYKEEECKVVLLHIIKFLNNRSNDDNIFEMPLDATIQKYRE